MSFLQQISNFSDLIGPGTKYGKALASFDEKSLPKTKAKYNNLVLRQLRPLFTHLDKIFIIAGGFRGDRPRDIEKFNRRKSNGEGSGISKDYKDLKPTLFDTRSATTLRTKNQALLEFKQLLSRIQVLNSFHHLIASEDVEAFNDLRKSNRSIDPLFSGLDLKNRNLQSVNFDNARIIEANLRHSNLTEAQAKNVYLSQVNLDETSFDSADLTSSAFIAVKGHKTDFTAAILQQAYINGELRQAKFTKADLTKAKISSSSFYDSDFSGANLESVKATRVSAYNSNFQNADLKEADVGESSFSGSDFRRANLQGAKFLDVDLTATDFRGTSLSGASFSGNLRDADFTGCDFKDVKIESEYFSQIKNPLSVKNVNFEQGVKWLFENIDSKEIQDVQARQVLKFLDIDKDTIKAIDAKLLTKPDSFSSKELILRLYLISKISTLNKDISLLEHQACNQVAKVLYQSCGNDLDTLMTEAKFLHSDLFAEKSRLYDSLSMVFNAFVLPRLEKFLDQEELKKLTLADLSILKQGIIPYLVIAISQNRFFSTDSDYAKLNTKPASLPESASHRMPSLLLKFSKGLHNHIVGFANSIRHEGPEGSWYPIINLPDAQYEITLPSNGKKYIVKNLLNYQEFADESSRLGHCIGLDATYVNKAKRGAHHYFSIREAESGKSLSTLEFTFEDYVGCIIKDSQRRFYLLQHEARPSSRPNTQAKEVLKLFLKAVKNGDCPFQLAKLGDDDPSLQLSIFENTIGTSFVDSEAITRRRMFDTSNVHSVQARAWLKLAQPRGANLQNIMQGDEVQEEDTGIGILDVETGETIQLGGYAAKKQGIPYDNYFIPNFCRGDLEMEASTTGKSKHNKLQFKAFRGDDIAEIDKGIERFFTTKIGTKSLDGLIKDVIASSFHSSQ